MIITSFIPALVMATGIGLWRWRDGTKRHRHQQENQLMAGRYNAFQQQKRLLRVTIGVPEN